MSEALDRALASLLRKGAPMPANSAAALTRSIQQWSDRLASDTIDEALGNIFDGLREAVKPKGRADLPVSQPGGGAATPPYQPGETGETTSSITGRIYEVLKPYENATDLAGAINLPFKVNTQIAIARGAGRFVSDQTDVDEYPAWELHRIYDRDVPRGFRAGPGGALIPVPDDDWSSRWQAAAQASGDDEAARIEKETGRMVALKSSGIWQALGDGAGGYDDALGNPFSPFSFNSGFGTDGVPRIECIELGLLRTDEQPEGSDYDFNNLISLPE